jgi:hypothetical protein
VKTATPQFSGKLSYREKLEKLWANDKSLSIRKAKAITGASHQVARTVHRHLVAAGKLPKPIERDFL